jgi:hypothetical protein
VIDSSIWTTAQHGLVGLTANGLLLLGSFWIARHGFKQPRGLATVLATAVVFWTACTVGVLTLGTFAALRLVPMLAWGAMILGIGGVFRQRPTLADTAPANDALAEPLSWDAVISMALLLSAALVLGMRSLLLAV